MAIVDDRFWEWFPERCKSFIRALVDSITCPLIIRDLDYVVVLANRAAEQHYERPLLGRRCYEIQRGRDEACDSCPGKNGWGVEEPVTRELEDPLTGEYLELTNYPVCDEGGRCLAVIETTRAVTHRVEAEHRVRELLQETTRRNQELQRWRRQVELELDVARQIQAKLVPQQAFCRPGICLDFLYRPSGEIGGDLYDVVPLGEERTGVFIADASGHGVGAAVMAAMIKIVFRCHEVEGQEPAGALAVLNRQLQGVMPSDQFATAFYGIYDRGEGSMRYSQAGHPPPMLLRSGTGEVVRLESEGFVLGTLDDARLGEGTTEVAPGDRLLLYTDGIVEAANEKQEPYGTDRLEEFFRSNSDLGAENLLERIFRDVQDFVGSAPITDDLTLVLAEAVPESAEPATDPQGG